MELNSRIIHGFSRAYLWEKFDNPVATPKFHFEMWDMCCSGLSKIAIAAPRFHAKSTAITHCFILAAVLFQVKDYVLIISDTEKQAKEFLGDIKTELVENEALIESFGISRIIRDNETDVICCFRSGKEFRICAYGAEQKIRGRKWRGKRPNLVVCDDLENDEAVMNEERRYKFRTWFLNALLRVGSKNCLFIIVGTILHQDSLLQRLVPRPTSVSIKTDGLRYWDSAQDSETGWHSVLYDAHNDDFTQILWPENYDKDYFERERRSYVAQGHPEGYSQEMRNRPLDVSVAYFRLEDLKPIENYEEHMEYYVGADLAISTQDQRAYTAIVVAGLTSTGVIKIVDVRRFRGDSLDICTELFAVQKRYKPIMIAIEKENIAKSIGPFLNEAMGRDGNPILNIREMPIGNQDKIKRAQSIRTRTRIGRVEFDHKASWWPDFREELIFFPRGTYADQVDAFAWIGLMLDNMIDVPTDEELLEEEYILERDRSYSYEDRGICPTTGY